MILTFIVGRLGGEVIKERFISFKSGKVIQNYGNAVLLVGAQLLALRALAHSLFSSVTLIKRINIVMTGIFIG